MLYLAYTRIFACGLNCELINQRMYNALTLQGMDITWNIKTYGYNMKIFNKTTILMIAFIPTLFFSNVSYSQTILECKNCDQAEMVHKIRGYAMQYSLNSGDYQFTIFDSAQMNLVDAAVNVTNNSSNSGVSFGIDMSIDVNVNFLPKTTSYQTAESNLEQYQTLKNTLIAETFRMIQDEPDLVLGADSSLQSAAQTLLAPGEAGLILEDKINEITSLVTTRENAGQAWESAKFVLSIRLRNFLDSTIGMAEIGSTFVRLSDGSTIVIEITFKASNDGPQAVVKVTNRAYFANGLRIPTAAFAMDDMEEVTEDMINLRAMLDYILSLEMNVAGNTGALTGPNFVNGNSMDGCIKIIDFIEEPSTGEMIPTVAQECQ